MVSYTIVVFVKPITGYSIVLLNKRHSYHESSQTNYSSQFNCGSTDIDTYVVGLHFILCMVVNHVSSFGSGFRGCSRVGSCFIHDVKCGIAVYGKALSWFRFSEKNYWATAIWIL